MIYSKTQTSRGDSVNHKPVILQLLHTHTREERDYSKLSKQADYTTEMLKLRTAPQHCLVAHMLKKHNYATWQ